MIETVYEIIASLQPDFKEFADNTQYHYWMDYACELDVLQIIPEDGLVTHLNERMDKLLSSSPEHHACVDVASTLEEALPSTYKGVFKYE